MYSLREGENLQCEVNLHRNKKNCSGKVTGSIIRIKTFLVGNELHDFYIFIYKHVIYTCSLASHEHECIDVSRLDNLCSQSSVIYISCAYKAENYRSSPRE